MFSFPSLTFHRYLYYQSFGIDACFRFKRRQISSYNKDPELGPGFAYMVAWEPYNRHLLQHADQIDVRECMSTQAPISTLFRSAHVQGYPRLNTPIQSSQRGTQQQVLCAPHAAMSSFSQRVLANSRNVRKIRFCLWAMVAVLPPDRVL